MDVRAVWDPAVWETSYDLRGGASGLLWDRNAILFYRVPFSDLPGGHMEDPAGKWIPSHGGTGFCPVRGCGGSGFEIKRRGQGFLVRLGKKLKRQDMKKDGI